MVFKIMAPAATFAGVKYNEQKENEGKGEKIHMSNFGWLQDKPNLTETDIKNYLDNWSSFNTRIKNKQFHAVLSGKGKDVSFETLKQTALQIMEKMGYKNNPILIYAHNDTKNNHVHIVTSRIDENGKKINHRHERFRSMKAMNEVLGLNTKLEFLKDIDVLKSYKFSSPHQANLLLEQKGYNVVMSKENDNYSYYKFGEIQGTYNKQTLIEMQSDKGEMKKESTRAKAIITKYKPKFDSIISKQIFPEGRLPEKPIFNSELTNHLKEKIGLEFVFFGNQDKEQPYGYVVIDHVNKCILKGSDVMPLGELNSNKLAAKELVVIDKKDQSEKSIDFPGDDSKDKGKEKESSMDIPVSQIDIVGDIIRGTNMDEAGGSTGKSKKKKKGRGR